MIFRFKSITIFVLLSFCAATGLYAADIDQSFSISKNLDLHHRFPRVTVDPETGNAYVAWVRIDNNYQLKTRTYAALCKLLSSGNFKVKPARLMSDPDVESQWWCDIAYNPEDKSSLVVWGPAGLHARKLKANGKIGGPINFIYSGSANRPVIAYTDSAPSAPGTGGYIIAYANYNSLTLGLWAIFSDADGNSLASAQMISDGYAFPGCYPTHILKDLNGTYLVAHIKEDTFYGDSIHIARVGKNGAAIANKRIGTVDPYRCSIVQLSKRLYLATSDDDDDDGRVYNQLFTKKLKTKGAPVEPMPGSTARECCLVKLENSNNAVQIFRRSLGQFYYRLINAQGQFVGDAKLLTDAGCLTDRPNAVCLPGSNKVLLVYTLCSSSEHYELKGLLFDPTK